MNHSLIRGGTVVDGTGAPGFAADVRVENGVITAIAPGLAPLPGEGAAERDRGAGGQAVVKPAGRWPAPR